MDYKAEQKVAKLAIKGMNGDDETDDEVPMKEENGGSWHASEVEEESEMTRDASFIW